MSETARKNTLIDSDQVSSRFCKEPRGGCYCDHCRYHGGVLLDASTVHPHCLDLFMREYRPSGADDAAVLDRLWIATTWQYPWRDAPCLDLYIRRAEGRAFAVGTVSRAAEILGLGKLKRLPLEIWHMIKMYSTEPHLFWRYVSVLEFVDRLAATPSELLTSVNLSQVVAWERGSQPELGRAEDSTTDPISRFTIDSFGIQKFERLSALSPYTGARFNNLAFIVQDNEAAFNSDIIAQFKDGLLHILVPRPNGREWTRKFAREVLCKKTKISILDTPVPPPDLIHSLRRQQKWCHCQHFQTLDPKNVTGITFFIYADVVRAIHAHTRGADSCAKSTFDYLTEVTEPGFARSSVYWVYVPVSSADKVLQFGIQSGCNRYSKARRYPCRPPRSPCYLLRTDLAGDIILGKYHAGWKAHEFYVSEKYPSTLIHGYNPERWEGSVEVLVLSDGRESRRSKYNFYLPQSPQLVGWSLSWASLDSVRQVKVFFDEDLGSSGACRGLLFEYENGGQRAVGQCRIGVDPNRIYGGSTNDRPSHLCCVPMAPLRLPGTKQEVSPLKIVFDASSSSSSNRELGHSHDRGEGDWACFPMKGRLIFWLRAGEVRINIEML
ncbi:hypothetical protein QBC46DRAFT_44724 [Diplogelasinospora grovesii]|uniref:Uncharacterized protein n=1 Tax=Diplogelasinospora grovesii TaxID=303347 RepID=A0AAN6NEF1_9PEZI|nr:hypothetical protein QBC46DRAFT_44724 [Diplogelasinospora grovesii]